MGTGHVMRCLALAQAWQDLGGEATLLTRDLPPGLAERMASESVALLPLPAARDDLQETCNASADPDWVVLDGYGFDAAYCNRVVTQARHVLIVDDLGLASPYTSELILNQNITARAALYPARAAHSELLCGGTYALLRREFRRPVMARDASAPCTRVLVTMGGSDHHNVTLKVIEALARVPNLLVKVVAGAANPHLESLQRRSGESGGRIEVLRSVDDMVAWMDWAQIAVSAGGTSILELASRGVPTLLVATADNQRDICSEMHTQGVMAFAGWHEDVTEDSLASTVRHLTSDAGERQREEFSTRGMALVDGRGAMRVAREMLARDAMLTVKVRPATPEDATRVFEWANDPETRAVSFTQSRILWEEHQSWFSRKLADPRCHLMIGENAAGAAIGMVRFDTEAATADVSINLAPDHRSRGLGTTLLRVACRELSRKGAAREVRALIKPGNAASQCAFKHAGFEPAADVDVAGQRALCMVLK